MMKRLLLLTLSLLMLLSVARAETVYDLGCGYRLSLPENRSSVYSNMYYIDDTMFSVTLFDLAELGYQQDMLDQVNDRTMLSLCYDAFGEIHNYRTEQIAAGIPCASVNCTHAGYEIKGVIMLNGTRMCAVLITNALTGQYPEETICSEIMNAFSVSETKDDDLIMAVSAPANVRTDAGYYLKNGPLLIDLSENDYNIVYQGMPEASLSVRRSGYSYASIDSMLKAGEGTDMMIWRLNEDGLTGKDAMIYVRAKEKKYAASDDSRKLSRADLTQVAEALAEVASPNGEYTIKEINGIPYIIFPFINDKQLRSVALINGGYVYVYVSCNTPLTVDDEAFLYTVLEHITVAE